MSRARNLPLLWAGRVGRAGRGSLQQCFVLSFLRKTEMVEEGGGAWSEPPIELLLLLGLLGPEGQALVAVSPNRAKQSNSIDNRQWIDIRYRVLSGKAEPVSDRGVSP